MTQQMIRLLQMNDVRLVGRLTRDPEVRYTPKGQAVARLDLAVNRRFKDSLGEWREEATFVPVTVWRDAAERCRERLKKGSPIYVEGRLRSTSWETKDGQKRSGIEVEAYRLQFLARTVEGASVADGAAPADVAEAAESEESVPAAPAAVGAAPKPGNAATEDDIPF
jgi:single-strand DNA-binding protein